MRRRTMPFVLASFVVAGAGSCSKGSAPDASGSSPPSASAVAVVEPWQPVDPRFKGCEGG